MYKNKKYKGAARSTKPVEQSSQRQVASGSGLRSIDENNVLKISNRQVSFNNDDEANILGKNQRLGEMQNDNNEQIDDDTDLLSSQNTIPSSQPKTQRRYLSQRITMLGGLSPTRTQSSLSSGKNYFEVVLIKIGVDLTETDTYVLSSDHVTFVNNLRSILKKNSRFPENLALFLDGFKEAIEDPKIKLKLLTCCTVKIMNTTNETNYVSQDSLIVDFLEIEFIQKEILSILFDQIKICATNDKESDLQGVPLLPLYLSQLKFVANIHGTILYENIMKIYEISTIGGKNIICENAEFIFEAAKHDNFVKYLIENTTSNAELLTRINVKTFTNLYLSHNVEKLLTTKILNYMKEAKVQDFPYLVQFLVKVKNEDENDLKQVVADLRLALDQLEINLKDVTEVQSLMSIFNYLKQGLIKSKKCFDIFLKHIQNRPEVKAIDLVLFLFLISIREDKFSYIEKLIRGQVKLERINLSVLSEAKRKYLCIECEGFNVWDSMWNSMCGILLHILNNFLREKITIVSDFAKDAFSIIFGIDSEFQKQTLRKLVDLACNQSSVNQSVALDALTLINNGYSKIVQNFGMLLLPMLDRINEIDSKQTRTILQLLCSVAYPLPQSTEDSSKNNLQDHLDMLVKKQVVNRSTFIKKQGIIGTTQLIDCIARTVNIEDDNDDIDLMDKSFISVNDIPEGNGRIAGTYITKIFSTCNYCAETLGLFYDELANVLSYKNPKNKIAVIDKFFLAWLTDIITNYFESNFVADSNILEENFEIELKFDKCLNMTDSDSESSNIFINIAGPVFKPSAESNSSIHVLSSLFNLTVTLHKLRYRNNLETLNAVLGFGIILPKCFGEDDNIFDEYDENTSRKILDIYFHAINWYRTVINAYVGQRDDELIRDKVIKRIINLIEAEQTVRELLKKAPVNYVPPSFDFINLRENKSTKKMPSTSKAAKQNNTEVLSILAQTQNLNNQANKIKKFKSNAKNKFDIIYGSKEIYRQIDADIIFILDEKVKLIYEQNNCEEIYLGLSEFQFVMTDLVGKIESIEGVKKIIANHTSQQIIYMQDFMQNCGKYLPKILMILEKIQFEIDSKLEEINNEFGHVDLFTDRMNNLKVIMGLCFRFLAAFFSYSGFIDNSEYQAIFKKSLQSITVLNSDSLVELSSSVIDKFFLFEKNMIDLRSAVYLFHMIKTLMKFSQKEIYNQKLRDLCKNFLYHKWYNYEGQLEKGALCNVLLDYLIKGFLKDSNFKRISRICTIIVDECSLIQKNDSFLKSFPNIHKANFPMLYKELGQALITHINEKLTIKSSDISYLKLWEENCTILESLLHIVKKLEIPRNFAIYLKYAHQFIKLFLLNGLPVLERSLRKSPELCNDLLKNLQNNTRYLHNLCCYSKKNKNSAIISQIPMLRETIETLVIKVKAALVANQVGSAFWMGNLKNKDIHGEEIKSQESLEENENSEGEIPDDGDDDETIDETINSPTSKNDKPTAATRQNSRSICF